ncbi:hypothetical protein VMCG_09273 [Cytospora schulzeri]|uniref:Uncharacterized protein n=1 Tax=Cytospora schulzeri TaxID=448051 RepID=A0A423VMJ2_9PEZI|nr:hypothetical protein VMCG_09273 [Valsa malicola]
MTRPVTKCKVVSCRPGHPFRRGIAIAFGTKSVYVVSEEVAVAADYIWRAGHLDANRHEATAQLDAAWVVDPPWQEAYDRWVMAQGLANAGGQERHLRVDVCELDVANAAAFRHSVVDFLTESGEGGWVLQKVANQAADAVTSGVAGPETD